MNSKEMNKDAVNRAQEYSKVLTPMGAYTSNSKGFNFAREKVAEFIK